MQPGKTYVVTNNNNETIYPKLSGVKSIDFVTYNSLGETILVKQNEKGYSDGGYTIYIDGIGGKIVITVPEGYPDIQIENVNELVTVAEQSEPA